MTETNKVELVDELAQKGMEAIPTESNETIDSTLSGNPGNSKFSAETLAAAKEQLEPSEFAIENKAREIENAKAKAEALANLKKVMDDTIINAQWLQGDAMALIVNKGWVPNEFIQKEKGEDHYEAASHGVAKMVASWSDQFQKTTIYDRLRVAQEFPADIRNPELPWSVHEEVLRPIQVLKKKGLLYGWSNGIEDPVAKRKAVLQKVVDERKAAKEKGEKYERGHVWESVAREYVLEKNLDEALGYSPLLAQQHRKDLAKQREAEKAKMQGLRKKWQRIYRVEESEEKAYFVVAFDDSVLEAMLTLRDKAYLSYKVVGEIEATQGFYEITRIMSADDFVHKSEGSEQEKPKDNVEAANS